jgi:hypothetical protein
VLSVGEKKLAKCLKYFTIQKLTIIIELYMHMELGPLFHVNVSKHCSCHPPHIVNSIPYSQGLPISPNCSDDEDFEREINKLKGYFLNRDYPQTIVKSALEKVKLQWNTPCPSQMPINDKETQACVMVIPYHPRNAFFQKAFNDIWSQHKTLIGKISKPMVAFRRAKNRGYIIVRSSMVP